MVEPEGARLNHRTAVEPEGAQARTRWLSPKARKRVRCRNHRREGTRSSPSQPMRRFRHARCARGSTTGRWLSPNPTLAGLLVCKGILGWVLGLPVDERAARTPPCQIRQVGVPAFDDRYPLGATPALQPLLEGERFVDPVELSGPGQLHRSSPPGVRSTETFVVLPYAARRGRRCCRRRSCHRRTRGCRSRPCRTSALTVCDSRDDLAGCG